MKNVPQTRDGEFLILHSLVCQLCGITAATLDKWMKGDDPPPRHEGGLFPAKQLGEWIRTQQIVKRGRGSTRPYLPASVVMREDQIKAGGVALDYNAERTRKEAAQADKIEMENALTSGQLVPVQDVENGWTNILSRVNSRIMRIPTSTAPLVLGKTDVFAVQRVLTDAVRDALAELSADWRENEDGDE